MSIKLDPKIHEMVKKAAEKKGISIKNYLENLVEGVGVNDKGVKIILTVPDSLTKKNKEKLQEWFNVRVNSLVETFYPNGD